MAAADSKHQISPKGKAVSLSAWKGDQEPYKTHVRRIVFAAKGLVPRVTIKVRTEQKRNVFCFYDPLFL
jgi:hypothetical protein